MNSNNPIAYITFRGDLNFSKSPFNDVDALLLSLLVGLDLQGLVDEPASIHEVYIKYTETKKKTSGELDEKELLLKKMAESVRFGSIIMDNFVKDINTSEEKTFYALTYKLSAFKAFVAFRGTDGSLMSWKENFNTLYQMPTKGQETALSYLENVLSKRFVKCYVAGHSKGGNLATYASIFCNPKLQKKIILTYSFDGPGFINNIENEPGYQSIRDRIRAFIPESCVVGNLLNPPYEKTVVLSSYKGMFQHDVFSWQADTKGFESVVSTDLFSESLSKKINDWIYSIPNSEMKSVVDELFDMFEKRGIYHISELLNMDIIKLLGMIKSMTRLSQENRTFLMIIFKEIRNSK